MTILALLAVAGLQYYGIENKVREMALKTVLLVIAQTFEHLRIKSRI